MIFHKCHVDPVLMSWLKLSILLHWQLINPHPKLLPLSGSNTPGLQYTHIQLPEAPRYLHSGTATSFLGPLNYLKYLIPRKPAWETYLTLSCLPYISTFLQFQLTVTLSSSVTCYASLHDRLLSLEL